MREKNRATLKEVQEDYKHSLVRGLLFELKAAKIPAPEHEHEFAESIGRKWRFDLCWAEEEVAAEVEGGTGENRASPSRHLSPEGFREDAIKYFEAAMLGWIVIRLAPGMIRDRTAVELIGRALKAKRKEKLA